MREFVDNHMGDEIIQRDLAFAPLCKNGQPKERDNIWPGLRVAERFFRQGDALVKSRQLIGRRNFEFCQKRVVCQLLDLKMHSHRRFAKGIGKACHCRLGQGQETVHIWRLLVSPNGHAC